MIDFSRRMTQANLVDFAEYIIDIRGLNEET